MLQSTCVLEAGLSNFHLMTVTSMIKNLKKIRPRVKNYGFYKYFSDKRFTVSPINQLSNEVFVNNYDGLKKYCKKTMDTLNFFAPIKKNYARGNQIFFMSKNISKDIMTKSRLRNKYLKHKSKENCLVYTLQRSRCVSLLRKTKMNYYGKLNEKDIRDNKKCWKTVKPFLSNKSINVTKFISVEM